MLAGYRPKIGRGMRRSLWSGLGSCLWCRCFPRLKCLVMDEYMLDDEVERHLGTVHILIGPLVGEQVGAYVLRETNRQIRFFQARV
ncbi:hypothetical protein [Paraburkholderia franconis]|uniref:hypothetical protein n=1 Tax=Paraburkholderia franconis TaxID=2654983 RepID=UPI00187B242E|nr:hypothetical protein [Paraburkholderia franconis]